MKQKENEDYERTDFEVVPEWVEDFMQDRLEHGFVISSMGGGWLMIDHEHTESLEDNR